MFVNTLISQKGSLEDMLWEEAGGRIDLSEDHGGQYEIIDNAKNGYLKVAFTEDGCGCYNENTIGAYKNHIGTYTTLQMKWDGCGWRNILLSNKGLDTVLPENFGLRTFLPKSDSTEYQITSSVFFLDAEIPQKGTDTQINLSYIPFGINMALDDHVLSYGYELIEEHGGPTTFIRRNSKTCFKRFQMKTLCNASLKKLLKI